MDNFKWSKEQTIFNKSNNVFYDQYVDPWVKSKKKGKGRPKKFHK